MIQENIPLSIAIIVIISFSITGILKIIIRHFQGEKVRISNAFSTGGMPSSHTTIVSSLTTSIFLYEGFSNLFVALIFISLIIMSDAMGVRMETGLQAKALNKLLKTKEFNEKSGHKPTEVLGGLFVGILTALLLFLV